MEEAYHSQMLSTKEKIANCKCEEAAHLLHMLNQAQEKLNKIGTENPDGFPSPWHGSFFVSGCFCQNAYDEDEKGLCTTSESCTFCQEEFQRHKVKQEILHIYEMCRNFLKKNK
jgi:hypothetical protein